MTKKITSKDIIQALRDKYSDGALVPELTIYDDYAVAVYYNSLSDEARKRFSTHPLDLKFQADPDFDASNTKFFRRIDALLLHNQQWSALEVKVSRADFKRDTYEKRRVWMKHTHRFIYVTPVGLITKDEVPQGCGWWEVDERGAVKVSKRASINTDRIEFPDRLVKTMFWRLSNAENERVVR